VRLSSLTPIEDDCNLRAISTAKAVFDLHPRDYEPEQGRHSSDITGLCFETRGLTVFQAVFCHRVHDCMVCLTVVLEFNHVWPPRATAKPVLISFPASGQALTRQPAT
jgi:hypothetical protein